MQVAEVMGRSYGSPVPISEEIRVQTKTRLTAQVRSKWRYLRYASLGGRCLREVSCLDCDQSWKEEQHNQDGARPSQVTATDEV